MRAATVVQSQSGVRTDVRSTATRNTICERQRASASCRWTWCSFSFSLVGRGEGKGGEGEENVCERCLLLTTAR